MQEQEPHTSTPVSARWQRVIGILGGLGPHAHIELERLLLAAAGQPENEQDYPEWVVVSIPATPDRTDALINGGPSPVSELVRGLDRLNRIADFAVIPCITAHAFLPTLRGQVALPILDVVEETLRYIIREHPGATRIGVLATSGSLQTRIFPRAAEHAGLALELISLLDLDHGENLQESLTMAPTFGPRLAAQTCARGSGGIKSGFMVDPVSGIPHRESLQRAAQLLLEAGAACVIAACTEIPLVLGREQVGGAPIIDPLQVAARAAVEIACGERDLPLICH